ncbi:hypothetical protein K4K59_011398 [Colletotrichum sp. SAR11_240]|nr:hypothetical protein K4K59_011398 [Colletotrichum sp. SAR11_240]
MPIALAFVPEIADIITLVGLGGGAVGGSVASWCHSHPGPGCVRKRDLLGLKDVPKLDVGKRQVGPCNVPSYNFDQCRGQVQSQGVQVISSIPAGGVAQFDNVPPACMNLASVLGGSCNGVTVRPTPCGSACMQWAGLSDDEMNALSSALNAA